jgi:hypothetical protein
MKLAAGIVAAALPMAMTASRAPAASNISNSLTGFTGNSSQAATQAALAAAGMQFTTTSNSIEDPPGTFIDPTVQFSTFGAEFGAFTAGDGGRNFIRTVQSDYANVSFTAEVSWLTSAMGAQAAYFGLGSAEHGAFRIADWGTNFSAFQLFLEVNVVTGEVFTLKNDNTVALFDDGTAVPGLDSGTNRLRMTYDWFQKTATFSVDAQYAGGPFVADATTPPVNLIDLYGPDGWPTEPARVYFGGDDGSVFADFQVTVTSSPVRLGDFTADGNITSADWVILRNNQLANLSGKTFSEAYFLGDVTADLKNNHADFVLFKALYDEANGVGSFEAMLAGVPEPSALCLILAAGACAAPALRRAARRAAR